MESVIQSVRFYNEKRITIFIRLVNNNDKFVTVSLKDTRGVDYGSIKLNIAHFEDQKKRKEWLYLSENSRDGTVARLQLSIIYLKSNVTKKISICVYNMIAG